MIQPNNEHSRLEAEIIKAGGVPDGYTEIDVDFFQFKTPGDKLEGKLINKGVTTVKNGRVGKYTIQRFEGGTTKKTAFLGSVQLDELMTNVAVGAEILVIFMADEPLENSSYTMKRFKVYQKNPKAR